MRAAFNAAIAQKKYRFANPWQVARIPSNGDDDERPEARILTRDEAKRFISTARQDRFEALWLLLLLSGLRIGEGLGLQWDAVNLDTGRVDVRRQLTEVDGKPEVGPLKTPRSRRVIDVGAVTLAALRRRYKAAGAEGHGSRYVFTANNGGFISRTNIRRRNFDSVCAKAGIKGLTPHGLRHSMTSHAYAAGLSPDLVARRLGHSTTRLSLDRYSHELPGQQREASDLLERRLAK